MGIIVRNRNVIVAPKTFTVENCPRSLNTIGGNGDPLYLRCVSLDERQKLLAAAHCTSSFVNDSGTRWYECQEDPARYLGSLSRH
jgi:hypothetical protein